MFVVLVLDHQSEVSNVRGNTVLEFVELGFHLGQFCLKYVVKAGSRLHILLWILLRRWIWSHLTLEHL